MGIEQIKVLVGGDIFTAWEQVKWRAAFDEGCRRFDLTAATELGAAATHALFALGTPIQIFANADLVLDGFVDRRRPKVDEDSTQIVITGRSKSGDLVDCSAVHDTGDFENMDPVEIGNAIAPGIAARFESDQSLQKIDRYRLTPGADVYSVVEHLCRDQSLTLTGLANGNMRITKAGHDRHAGGLYHPGNILSAEADHNATNRHSKIMVRGQNTSGHGNDALQIEATAADSKVSRTRPKIIIHRESATKAFLKGRAATRRDRAAGNALRSDVEVQGFRDDAGKLFEPGFLIWTESETLGIAQDMLIESLDCTQHYKGGSKTSLGLVDPRAYAGSKGKGNQSSGDNDFDDSEPE